MQVPMLDLRKQYEQIKDDVMPAIEEVCKSQALCLGPAVEQFEKGQMKLADSVDRFERGMELLKRCNQQLNEAESRVEKLLRRIEPDTGLMADDDTNAM